MAAHETVLAEVPTGDRWLVRVVRQQHQGRDVIDARVWKRSESGALSRTQLGWTVSEAQARTLAPGFDSPREP